MARTLAGRYELDSVVGRGGMSTVYRASDLMLGRTVAVKVLLAALAEEDPTYVARFEREARAAAALTNRAVVTIYDAGIDDGERFIAMEYVDGRSLAEILRDDGPLDTQEAVRIATEVAGALGCAHGAGILHRDIKPANVMVTREGVVKVLDFGIARPLDGTTITQAATLIGTAAYMAPERALGEPGDARSDIYSLGCLLYAMLAGGPPFTGELSAAVLQQHINADPRPPRSLAPRTPAALDALVLAMLAKEPAARPQTAAEVRDRLAALQPLDAPTRAPALTAATVPLEEAGVSPPATGATRVISSRSPHGAARRAALAAILTAAIALAAIALFDSGSSQTASTGTHGAVTTPTTSRQTSTANAPSAPAPTTPKPKKPKAKPPTATPAPPPGHQKKHDHGHGEGGD